MKKFISLILIIVMMVFSLTSCDELINEVLGKLNIGQGNESNDNEGNDVGSVIYTITKEDWDALDTITNYTVNAYITLNVINNGESATIEAKQVYKSSENAVYDTTKQIKHSNESIGVYIVSYERYCTINDGKRYTISLNQDGKWGATEYNWKLQSLHEYLSLNNEIQFDDLTYNAEMKAYTYSRTEGNDLLTVEYYFKNGKPIRIYATGGNYLEGDFEGETIDIKISGIGITPVVIPQTVLDSITYE